MKKVDSELLVKYTKGSVANILSEYLNNNYKKK